MLRFWLSFFGAILSLAACAETQDVSRFEIIPESEDFPVAVSGERVVRGYLVVPQSDAADDELALRLPVVIIRAASPSGRAPVVFLPGGPGVGDLSAARCPGAYPWTADRDFIVFGRRGTRFAEPSLSCPEVGEALTQEGTVLAEALEACRSDLLARGVRLDAYHTAASVRDLEALREALGAEQLAFFALSYGTRIALSYARDYPDRVEAMALDSPLPHAARFDDAYPANLEAVLRRVARLCTEDAACDAAFPELERRYFEAVSAAPMEGGADQLSRYEMATAADVSGGNGLASAPILMDAAARGDTALRAFSGGSSSAGGFDWGVRLSVWCSEALPFAARAAGPAEASFGGLDGAVFDPETCRRWDVPVRPEAELDPPDSAVPTLILAGELDALTPPAFARLAADTLPRSRVIILPAGFHTESTQWDGDGCAMSLAARFFEAPEAFVAAGGTPDCIAARTYPAFLTSPEG